MHVFIIYCTIYDRCELSIVAYRKEMNVIIAALVVYDVIANVMDALRDIERT